MVGYFSLTKVRIDPGCYLVEDKKERDDTEISRVILHLRLTACLSVSPLCGFGWLERAVHAVRASVGSCRIVDLSNHTTCLHAVYIGRGWAKKFS